MFKNFKEIERQNEKLRLETIALTTKADVAKVERDRAWELVHVLIDRLDEAEKEVYRLREDIFKLRFDLENK